MFVSTFAGSIRDAWNLGQAFGESARPVVVVGEPLDVVVERKETGRRQDARLAHRPAEHLLPAPGLLDQLGRAGEAGAHRGAESLGEVDPGGIEVRRPSRRRRCRSRPRRSSAGRRPDGCSARVRGRCRGRRGGARAARLVPPREVRGLLDADEPWARRVAAPRRARTNGASSSVSGVKVPSSPSSSVITAPESMAGPPASASSGCGLAAHEDLIAAGADVDADRDLVAHRPGGQKHGGLLTEERGDPLLQLSWSSGPLASARPRPRRRPSPPACPSLGRVWVSE